MIGSGRMKYKLQAAQKPGVHLCTDRRGADLPRIAGNFDYLVVIQVSLMRARRGERTQYDL